MRIDRKLHLKIPIYAGGDDEGEPTAYVHSSTIGPDLFDRYWNPLSLAAGKLGHPERALSSVGIADKMLRDAAMSLNQWDGPEGVQQGLMNHIFRQTHVLIPGENGWEMHAYDNAKKANKLPAEDAAQVEAAVIFFTCLSAGPRMNRVFKSVLAIGIATLGAELTSLSCSDLVSSLATSTTADATGKKKTA
jgi:hypothetical protein